MATILLNGVAYDAANVTDFNDKLTFRGGSSDDLNVNLAGGDDLIDVDLMGENVTNATMRGGEDDDVISVVAGDAEEVEFINPANIGGSLIGGPGKDIIRVGDGLAKLTGTIKGNEDDDNITVARAVGGFVQGNSGDDTITLGFEFGYGPAAGSRAKTVFKDSSINGSSGDDVTIIAPNVALKDTTIRGNEGSDNISAGDATASGSVAIEGNAGDDAIDAAAITGGVTVRGGQGDDTLRVGNGQTVYGGLGADTFVVGAAGGVTIEDYDRLDKEECFCDDEIQISNIAYDSYTYAVEKDLYTSKSSWLGNLKVKAVLDAETCPATVTAKLTATKTSTLNATAVAFLKVTKTNPAITRNNNPILLPDINYPAIGTTQKGATFDNGNAGFQFGKAPLDQREGIGKAFASNTGYWTAQPEAGTNKVNFIAKVPYASTYAKFEKGDFSFLQLTKTEKAGCSKTQKLVFDDATRATITNHWASFNKVKNTTKVGLYDLHFGTNNFEVERTGKAYMVLTEGLEDKVYETKTLTAINAGATAKVTLTLNKAFQAWKLTVNKVQKTEQIFAKITNTEDNTWASKVSSEATGRYLTKDGDLIFKEGKTVKGVKTYETLDSDQLYWSTLQKRGLLTISINAQAPTGITAFGISKSIPNTKSLIAINNSSSLFALASTNKPNNAIGVNRDVYVTNSADLILKIKVSESATAKASQAQKSVVSRVTYTGQEFNVTACPSFPSYLATSKILGKVGKDHGDLVTENGGTKFGSIALWTIENGLHLGEAEATVGNLITADNQGFFSASDWKVSKLAAAGMGDNVGVTEEGFKAVAGAPFRVLFLDTKGTDNGLYIYSGTANYKAGNVTAINTAPAGTLLPSASTSGMFGKHTIVKVTGDKGHEIAMSDINFV